MAVTPADIKILKALTEFRVATVPQLSVSVSASEQLVRRRSRKLKDMGLICITSRAFGKRGRPEGRLSLTNAGVALLQEQTIIDSTISCERVTAERLGSTVDHQILLNWVAIECDRLRRTDSRFEITFVSSTSPHHLTRTGGTLLYDHVVAADGTEVPFTPDAVFSITRRSDGKSLLFFAEIDMGTEPLSRRNRDRDVSVQQKIDAYRIYLAKKGYKRYERPARLDHPFNGFRLLFVTHAPSRANKLCQLIQSMAPTPFAWVTTMDKLLESGADGDIWAAGGALKERRTILSSATASSSPL